MAVWREINWSIEREAVASSYVGRHAIASLVVSADTHASREILRVENAETDTRMEAAMCRQFGGMALVMFLIYRGSRRGGAAASNFYRTPRISRS